MNSFRFPLLFFIYKAHLFLPYLSTTTNNILLNIHPDGSQRQLSSFRDHQTSKKTVASSATAKSTGKSTASSVIVVKPNGKAAVSSANPMEPNAATDLSSMHGDQVMFFREVSLGPREAELMFRVIHFWEARNPNTKTLIGQEMLLIDREGTVIQGFVPASRVGRYELAAGSVYKLINFFGSRSKDQYRVADHSATASFSWNSSLSVLENPPVQIPEDRFRFHTYEEFKSNCDSKGDLYDYVGHMKLVNGQTMTDHIVLDEADIAEKRHLCVHVQTHDGPVMKLYLWDKAASDFCQKFKSYGSIPSVLLVTTVNPKHLGGTLALTSMSSSRVFMDADVQPSKEYLEWLVSNSEIANRVAAEVVTKPESVTLEELYSYIKQKTSKVAWFECTATIDDVVQGSAWYYISCGGCNSKAVKGPTSLICNNKRCGKSEVTGVPQYLTKISVYDKSEQALFVILGDAGKDLTGKHAAELVANYFETNVGVGSDHCVPVPDALLEAIGKTCKFIVKVSDHNLTGKTQTITVTKILPAEAPLPSTPDGISKTGGDGSGPFGAFRDSAGDRARKATESLESDEAKRSKSG
ncbi:hypothetical protein HID58_087873 [Brassica napus]|uniref:Replication factor A C-terminal domain-containing protein n=2 Tax=Brassica TaxID=3705 RepID=A0ABQ7XUL3_BRANA|nr:uncharacterized protein LOC111211692 [Brassica napus]KAG2275139.1 hypothetical protein Bca52824_057694 [Brassica carinata]KAH0859612.1 hypothetical protein HID58_087873 [Brassica napus]